MKESVLTSVVLPLSLFVIMLGMGLSLVVDDFKRVVRYPKAMAVGLTNQLVLLPLIGFGIATAFALEPAMAVGLMIIAACPGGVTSNLITHVSRGDTALSISLTAINSAITVITIPLIVAFALDHFVGEARTIEMPVLKTILQIVAITVVPVGLGMIVRRKATDFADRMERPARIASSVIFVLIVVGIIAANVELIREHFVALSGVTLALNVATMALGFVAARLASLNMPQSLAITIESGIQNGTLAIVLATSILKQGDMALPAGIYSLIMFMTGGLLMVYFGALRKPGDAEAEAATS